MNINGKELRITPASFSEALALQKAIGRALKGTKLDLPESSTEEINANTFSGIIDAILGVAISDEVEGALFVCSQRALLGDEKIDRDFFEKVENREHYFMIMAEVIKVNVGPFIKGLVSKFGGLDGITEKFQKLK